MIDEALLDAEVQKAVERYEGVVSKHVLEKMRLALRMAMLTHPDVAPLTRAALQKKDVEASHEAGPEVDAAAKAALKKKPAAGDGG